MTNLCKNPKYNADGTIDIDVNHPVLGWIPFTASPNDSESHGLLIYQAALSGAYGEVAPYVKSEEEFISDALAERERRVYAIDQVAMNPIRWGALTDEEKAAMAEARERLLVIEQQEGFPQNIIWPDMPAGL